MQAFTQHTGKVLPLDRPNVDTDAIIPKQYLKSIKRTGFGPFLFDDWRYLDAGDLSIDPATRRPNPDFVLNDPRYAGASILLAHKNFGCGSSREHAPWALLDFGIRCVISTSFADIFFNNCFKNGILPITLPQDAVEVLMDDAAKGANARMTVDLENQTVSTSDGQQFRFEIDPFRKHCLLNGLDDIGLTMEKSTAIDRYETQMEQARPWV